MPRATPTRHESHYSVDELFFSTTDRGGRIRAGNDVFVRVSRHPEDELVGSPHNIIRHPDMPRAVFRLLWDELLAGRAIAGYVKNMAADGSFYWVMATVVPAGDGFLSVRLKPTGPLLPAVAEVYAAVREFEAGLEASGVHAPDVAPQSLPVLVDLLRGAGFPDYGTFMRTALPQEIQAREEAIAAMPPAYPPASPASLAGQLDALTHQLRARFTRVAELTTVRGTLNDATVFVRDLAEDIRLSAVNGSISAARFGQSGAPLAVVADAMSACAAQIATTVVDITGLITPCMDNLADLAFQISTAKVQVDVACQFARQVMEPDHGHRETDLHELVECLSDEVAGLVETQARVSRQMRDIREAVRRLDSHLSTMAALQIAGRVETATSGASGFAVLFDQVRDRLEETRQHVTALTAVTSDREREDDGRDLTARIARLRELTNEPVPV